MTARPGELAEKTDTAVSVTSPESTQERRARQWLLWLMLAVVALSGLAEGGWGPGIFGHELCRFLLVKDVVMCTAVLKQRTSSIATAVFAVAIAHRTTSLSHFTAPQ